MKFFRENLKKEDLYENVTIQDKNLEKSITEWITNINKSKEIHVTKFKALFSKLEEVVFPIKVTGKAYSGRIQLKIEDDEKKEYYMMITIRSYPSLVDYSIGRRGNVLERNMDRQYVYTIAKGDDIILKEAYAGPINDDGTNMGILVFFTYNYKSGITTATLKKDFKEKAIKIEYPFQILKDSSISNYLLLIADERKYSCKVTLILKDIMKLIEGEKENIHILSEINGEMYSELSIEDGKVIKYSYTEEMENEICLHKISMNETIEKFLKKYGK